VKNGYGECARTRWGDPVEADELENTAICSPRTRGDPARVQNRDGAIVCSPRSRG
jgi:hypothetical protein